MVNCYAYSELIKDNTVQFTAFAGDISDIENDTWTREDMDFRVFNSIYSEVSTTNEWDRNNFHTKSMPRHFNRPVYF